MGGNPSKRASSVGKQVTTLLSSDHRIGISPITITEVHTNLCKWVRQTDPTHKPFDGAWFEAYVEELMRLIKGRRMLVLDLPPKVFETAMMHVTAASLEHGRNLRGWDAVHVVCASSWSRQLGERVILLTGDRPVAEFVETYPEFKIWVDVVDPETI